MESAAIATMESNATATSAIVKPRSFELRSVPLRRRWIRGGSMGSTSVFVECHGGRSKTGWTRKFSAHQTAYAAELPLVRVLNGDACSDQIYCVNFLDAAPIDGEHQRGGGSARGTWGSKTPSQSGSRKGSNADAAGSDIFRDKVVIYHLKGISDRSRD